MADDKPRSVLDRIIWFCLTNRLIVVLSVVFLVLWGVMVAPFDWRLPMLPRAPVPVDAIPDIGENQQIVFTSWPGRSPQDVEDQVTYPLTTALLGISGVRSIRSFSMFGFASIYVIFDEGVEFYWSRSRLLEKLNSLPAGTLPPGVQPGLGPDATPLGQIFWYTLEGRDRHGNPTGGWDLDELRSIQDYQVRYALMSAPGISEVASVGGHVREYQVDVDPLALRFWGLTLAEVGEAVRQANREVGARTIEINRVEYVVRGLGFVRSLEDLENSVVAVCDNTPVFLKTVAHVSLGPALRRGALDKDGAEVVGGVAVVRYGENPLAAINHVKQKIREIAPGLPGKTLADGTVSRVTIVPFYDRTGLIHETLATLDTALTEEILVTIIVILLMVWHLRSSLLISALLPLAVLMCFVAMKTFHVDANIVALSGIAIAIGTMVDMGIIVCENILRRLDEAVSDADRSRVVYEATREVGGAVLTAILTTIVGFLPVFTMIGPEGRLFRPLAFTKTFALVSSVIVALVFIPPFASMLFGARLSRGRTRWVSVLLLAAAGIWLGLRLGWWPGLALLFGALYVLGRGLLSSGVRAREPLVMTVLVVFAVGLVLARHWHPLGVEQGMVRNLLFVGTLIGGTLVLMVFFQRGYPRMLNWCLAHRLVTLGIPLLLTCWGFVIWLGFDTFSSWLPRGVREAAPVRAVALRHPGLGREFMPPLDEGSFLLMPTTMPHASIGEVLDVLAKQDRALASLPEVESAVGKLGRAESALDPAPVSMIETVINYRGQYLTDGAGRVLTFGHDAHEDDLFRSPAGEPLSAPDGEPYVVSGRFVRDDVGALVPDRRGRPFRLWRPALDPELNPGRAAWPGIRSPDDIWRAIQEVTAIPGTTPAPRLQPIAARLVMLQSGMRAPMGIKVRGQSLEQIERAGIDLERLLKQVPGVNPDTVIADRIVGKPYLEIVIDRRQAARYGIRVHMVQEIIEVGLGGRRITTTVEGRERYPVRVRYMRELRDTVEDMERILVPAADGSQVPLSQLAEIRYVRGPQMIKSEDTFLVGYVIFDKQPGWAEVEVVEQAREMLEGKIRDGELVLPSGVNYAFAGTYENQIRAARTLRVVLPLSLLIIFIILYLQFGAVSVTFMVFSGILVAWSGGFILLWLYGRPWFLDVVVWGLSLRELFQVHPVNLSVAVWVGFLALFGIASDNGVVMTTYLRQSFARSLPVTRDEIRAVTIEAARRRVRPCLMTTGTTILALLPVLTSRGRGADIMVPMAIPSFGGMVLVLLTLFVIPVLYCMREERRLGRRDDVR